MGWRRLLSLSALLVLGATCAHAEIMPSFSQLVTADEAPLLTELNGARTQINDHHWTEALASLDAIVAKTQTQSKFRGAVQMIRAELLDQMDRTQESGAAVEEAIRLLPGYSGPLLTGFRVYTFSNRDAAATDLLLRAIAIDPSVVRDNIEDYDVQSVFGRLAARKDTQRLRLLSERILGIGWRGSEMGSRSSLAAKVIDARLAEGKTAEARALVSELTDPSQIYEMLASKRYEPLWPDLERWSGPKMTRAWSAYLREARARWNASHSPDTAKEYAAALSKANRNEELAATFLPVLTAKLDPERDHDLLYIVARTGRALGSLGRWKDGLAMYEMLGRVWPLGDDINALNISANQANFLMSDDRPADALAVADRSIRIAERSPNAVNIDAVQTMHGIRACALAALKRGSEAQRSLAMATSATDPEAVVWAFLCTGDYEGARTAIITALRDDDRREQALATLQSPGTPPMPSAYQRRMRSQMDKLRADPAVVSEVNKVGRMLPFAFSDGAAGDDDMFAPPAPSKQPDSATS